MVYKNLLILVYFQRLENQLKIITFLTARTFFAMETGYKWSSTHQTERYIS
jgi:hypothetical protein